MAINCNGVIARTNCNAVASNRYELGRVGYVGAPIPKAIVIHQLTSISADGYGDQLTSPLPRFLCAVPTPNLCKEFPATQNPKSVHFVVTNLSAVQYIELTSTAFGIDYLLGSTWPGLLALEPITDVNGPFIHIAIEGECANSLIQLLCCIGVELGISLPIIAASDLQADRPELTLNPSIQTQVDNCVASGGFPVIPAIPDLVNDIVELQECCFTNTSDIVTLKTDVELLTNRTYILEQKVTGIENQLITITNQIAVIPSLVAQITTIINQITDIQNRCCPEPLTATCFRYQLTAGNEMLITPNQPVWLNLPVRVEDRDDPNCTTGCEGPIVHPGPLWQACLEDCTWDLRALVRFRLTNWCAGKKASLYLVACGKKYLLAEETISFTGMQAITLKGTFLLPAGCCDVHLLVATNDDKIVTAKVVEFAEFSGCCS